MTGRLLQLSGVIVDHIYWIEDLPAVGSEAIVRRSVLCAGGGFNAMVAARRSGMAVAYAGTLGSGPFADIVASALAREGIATLRPRLEGHDQGCCTCLVDRRGERTFVASSSADGIVTAADLAGLRPAEDDWCLLSGYALGYPESLEALTGWLRDGAAGLRLVFDPAPLVSGIPQESLDAALKAATWISANRVEAAFLTGSDNPAVAAAALSHGRAGGAVIRDGANGCYLATQGGPAQWLPSHPVTAIDTNGAGDTHVGAFIAAIARDETPDRAARLANVAAALSTTIEGPSTAPMLNDVLSVLGERPEAARIA